MTSRDIEITWLGNTVRFGTDSSPVVIGRSSASSIMIPDGIVSRRHLVLTWSGERWNVEDVSTHGTFDPIGVKLSRTWVVGSDGAVRLGSTDGTEVYLRLVTADTPPPVDESFYGPKTVVDYSPPPRPRNNDGMLVIPEQSVVDDSDRVAVVSAADQQPVGQPAALVAEPEGEQNSELIEALAVESDPRPDSPVPIHDGADPLPLNFEAPVRPMTDTIAADNPQRVDPQPAVVEPELDLRGSTPAIDLDDPAAASSLPPATGLMPDENLPNPAETFVESSTLRLHVDGEDYLFLPGVEITIGRDPSCTVVVDEHHTLVSRKHLRAVHQSGRWWFEDISSKGSFVDGRALTGPYKAEGAFVVELGDRIGGTPLRVVTAGEHRAPRNVATIAVAAIAGVALLLVSFLAWLMFRGGADEAATLDDAKRSTVMLLAGNGRGSGFFVSDSLILTNQHVAALADQLVVAVSEESDEPAKIQYIAELVESHPFLDLAVLRVTNSAQVNDSGTVDIGPEIEALDVPNLEMGSSGDVTLGDPIFSTGFPGRLAVASTDDSGQLRLSPVSTSRGEAANFAIWPGCSNPDFETFIPVDAPEGVTCDPDGDVNRGVLIASFVSGEGASGSPVVHDGKVIAVVFAGEQAEPNVSRSITSDAFDDWLNDILSSEN